MKDEHIIERLDAGPLAQLSQTDRDAIEQHVATCEACRREYSLARFAEDLVRVRVADAVEPPPFFQTRVLAAWRERAVADFWSFARMWRNAGALVSSMAATVAVLVALTFVMPGTTTSTGPADAPVAQANTYTAEDVIFDSEGFATVSDGQAATEILDEDDDGQ